MTLFYGFIPFVVYLGAKETGTPVYQLLLPFV